MTTFRETDWLCMGIDPGANGAYSLIDSELNVVMCKAYGKTRIHKNTINKYEEYVPNIFDFGVDVFNECAKDYNVMDVPLYIAIEAVTPPAVTSKKGAFNFGFYYGLQLATATKTGKNIMLVPPHNWQSFLFNKYGFLPDVIAKEETKHAIGMYLYKMFDNKKLFLNRAGNIDFNKTDSMGIALYLRDQLKNNEENIKWLRC